MKIHKNKGRVFTEEHKKKLSESHKGIKYPKSFGDAVKKRMLGKKFSLETINKMKGRIPWNKGIPQKEEIKKKISEAQKGNKSHAWGKKGVLSHSYGRIVSEETKEKLKVKAKRGEEHYLWKKDRNTLKKSNKHKNTAYKEWRKNVYKRDNWKCKINNGDCEGRIEAHHILPWRDYEELRYDINNGITLCHNHHPRKRSEESRLSSYFIELIKQKYGRK